MGRRQLSWLPEGEAPPPYLGTLGVDRKPSQPLHLQQSFPDLATYSYRLVALTLLMLIFCI